MSEWLAIVWFTFTGFVAVAAAIWLLKNTSRLLWREEVALIVLCYSTAAMSAMGLAQNVVDLIVERLVR